MIAHLLYCNGIWTRDFFFLLEYIVLIVINVIVDLKMNLARSILTSAALGYDLMLQSKCMKIELILQKYNKLVHLFTPNIITRKSV